MDNPVFPGLETILFLTRDCNLDCSYCYQHPRTPSSIPGDIQRKAIELASIHSTSYLPIGFFGGEPLLRLDLLQEAVALTETLSRERGIPAIHTLATNGTLLDLETARWLSEHRFLVQLSLDGMSEAHDAHRGTRTRVSLMDQTLAALEHLATCNVPFLVGMVVTPVTGRMVHSSFNYLTRELGVDRISLSAALNQTWTPGDLVAFERSMELVVEELKDLYRRERPVELDFVDEKISAQVHAPFRTHTHCPFGWGKIAVDTDGTIYPCDRVSGAGNRTGLAIGHVNTGIQWDRVHQQRREVAQVLADCGHCPVVKRCRNWCGCMKMDASGSLAGVSPAFCALQRLAGRLADELAGTLFDERTPSFMERWYGSVNA